MKSRFILFVFLLFCLTGLNAQTGLFGGSVVPFKPQSPLFGKDIVIQDTSDRDQRNVAICSAFNGWLYAVYSYPIGIEQAIAVLRSIDNGINWELLGEGGMIFASSTTRVNIIACGNSINDLKLFVGYVYFIATLNTGGAYVIRYKAEPFGYEDELLKQDGGIIKDLALSSDYMYPSINSNPYSIGVLYSRKGVKDTLVFRSSSNGGISLDSRHKIATSSNYFHKVSLNYGRSPTWNSGRYFAAWEEQDNANSVSGHIYTSHSEPDFNSPFTSPVLLDSLDASTANKASNPVISCQNNAADNDSSNLTEVVLFEKYVTATSKYNIAGCYNKKATNSNNFQKFTIDASINNKLQPDICFNAFDSTFIVTYFDSTAQKLPYYKHDFNMINPDSWVELSAGYNDYNNLVAPHPKVIMDFGKQMGANAWLGTRIGGNGAAMFDSPFTYYTGIPTNSQNDLVHLIGSYPNPCSTTIRIAFKLKNAGNVTIDVMDIMGQTLRTVTDQVYSPGKHIMQYDVSNLPDGNYLYKFRSGDFNAAGKFTVVR
ncbi:MAG: T9SS type A sorting domain-containing protein [Bacteroidales bacterium]